MNYIKSASYFFTLRYMKYTFMQKLSVQFCKVVYTQHRKSKWLVLRVVDSISYLIHYIIQFLCCAHVKHKKQLVSITHGGRDSAVSTSFSCFDYKKHLGYQWAGKPLTRQEENNQREQWKTERRGKMISEGEGRKWEGKRQKGIERVRVNEAWSCIYPN